MQCATCGTPAQPGDVFCGVCGADLGAQAPAASATAAAPQAGPPPQPSAPAMQPAGAQPPARRSRVPLVIALVVGGIVLLCACAGVAGFALFAPLRQVITEVQ